METELRNLKSESSIQPGLYERVKGIFAPPIDKGKMTMREHKDDIESKGLMDKETGKVKTVISETKGVI